jgi:phosphopantothenoylcysteine decarboxylase/phosphopantothenate--cysteine ligase
VDHKIKKEAGVPAPVELVANPDVLAELVSSRAGRPAGQVLVGFAAETGGPYGDVLTLGRAKLARKPVDLLVVNEVGGGLGFEVDHNAAVVLGPDGSATSIERTSKDLLAHRVLDLVAARLSGAAAAEDVSPA